ncbi:MAG: diguanylate cyclase [Candidatus Methylomirabilales bacterium]
MATVLIVDDDALLREMIREHLEPHGLHVVEARGGQEALVLAKRATPDLILLDVIMPDLDGLQVCRTLKGDETTRVVPVVLLTSREGLEDRIRGLDAGASDYLTKPVQPGELLARVKAHLRTRELCDDLEQRQRDFAQLLDLSKAVASNLRPSEIFHLIVEHTAQLVGARRCSLIVIGEEGMGYVVASQDNPRITRLPIALDRYPEIQEAIRKQQPVVVEDVADDPLMVEVRDTLLALEFRSLIVVPISLRGTVVGTLVLRTARSGHPFTARELQLCQLIAEVAAIALQNAHLFESLELANLNLERLTLIDDLTQAYNRRFLFRTLEEEVERAQRYGQALCCIMVDVDDFKRVNDRYGHAHGDVVLKELAAVIQGGIRRGDLLARYGGEEFVLLLPHTEGQGAWEVAERIGRTVREHVFPGIAPLLPLTISQGIASYSLNPIGEAADLLKLADRAMYRAKHSGKDAIACAWAHATDRSHAG